MKKSLKFLLLLLIAFVAALFVLVQSFKDLAERNREQVHQELQRFLGKDATFDRLEASLWGGVGFSAEVRATTSTKSLGQSVATGAGADGNFDGQITQADYTVWKSHFGQTSS